MSIFFLLNQGGRGYGAVYGFVNFFGAGVLLFGTIVTYIRVEKWKLVMLTIAMAVLTVFNVVTYIIDGALFTTGFPLIAYNLLYIVGHLHFLGKGVRKQP
jgi:hypothetical protein